jgi:DNA-binding NarL/FixJ family response regulator
MNLLLADDSAMVRKSLVAMLSKLEAVTSISQAEDGDAAIEFIDSEQFDIVILDIQMPGKNGISVLEHIADLSIKPVAIVLTNYSIAPYRKKCYELGADYFLDKSLEFKRISEIIAEHAVRKN